MREGETFDASAIPAAPSKPTEATAPAPRSGGALPPSAADARVAITPIARKLATEKGIDISLIKGTGPDGRITKEDVLAAAEAVHVKQPAPDAGIRLGMSLPLTRMREIIGQRLTASSRDTPHVIFSCEVDGTGMTELRNTFVEAMESATGVRLSFNDIIMKAVADIIVKYPLFNASLEGKMIKIHPDVNIGLALALPDGLVVPVIRKVNEKTLSQIAIARKEIVDRADRKKLTLDDLTGGTFTISNLGRFDIDSFTSIINPPEAAILSVAKMKEKPVVIKGEIAIRPVVYIGLSADHRVVDGAMAAEFLQELRRILESPFQIIRI